MLIGSYPPNADESMARSVVLHELGHALGLVHEHQSPNAQIPWNTEAVYAYYYDKHRWDRPYVDKHIFQKYAANESQFTVFDPTSIMIYPIPEEFTIGGFSVKWNQTLSKMDKEFVRSKYGRTNESPNP